MMNTKLLILSGFLAGCGVGAGSMVLLRHNDAPALAKATVAPAPAKKMSSINRERTAAPQRERDDFIPYAMPTRRSDNPAATASNALTVMAPANPEDHRQDDRTPEERMQQFMSFWSNRVVSARTNFIANAKLNEDQTTKFDVLVTAMNLRLQQKLDPAMEELRNGWRPTPEDRVRLMSDISSVLVLTYDEMDRNLPPNWRNANSNSNLSLTQFVDPKYRPFMQGFRGGGRGGPGGPGGPPRNH